MSRPKYGTPPNLRIIDQDAPRPSGLMPEGVDEPDYVLRGNKVKCLRCGTALKTRAKYVAHFLRSHNA